MLSLVRTLLQNINSSHGVKNWFLVLSFSIIINIFFKSHFILDYWLNFSDSLLYINAMIDFNLLFLVIKASLKRSLICEVSFCD